MVKNTLKRLQTWYRAQCNGDWEHTWGIKIETLDNPGWHVQIDLNDTGLERVEFGELNYGVGPDADASGDDWCSYKVDGATFQAYGGPDKLDEMLTTFLDWAEGDSNRL